MDKMPAFFQRGTSHATDRVFDSAPHAAVPARNSLKLVKAGWAVCCLLPLIAAAGCSDGRPTRVPVSGRVLIDGEPVTKGSIRFVPEGARASSGDLDSEGRFSLSCFDGNDGAVIGTHRVQVAAREVTGDSKVRWFAPTKYSDFRSSGITVEISEPTDALVIELTWDGKKPRGN